MEVLKKSMEDILGTIQQLDGADRYLVMAFVKTVLEETESYVVSDQADNFSIKELLARCSVSFSKADQVECLKAKDSIKMTILQEDRTQSVYWLRMKHTPSSRPQDIMHTNNHDEEDNNDISQIVTESDTTATVKPDLDAMEQDTVQEDDEETNTNVVNESLVAATSEYMVYEEVTGSEDCLTQDSLDSSSVVQLSLDDLKPDGEESYSQIITLDDQGNPVVYEQEVHGDGGEAFNTLKAIQLRRPRTRKSSEKDQSLVCKECKRQFPHISNLRVHMRRHTGELPFGCTYCSKRFTTKQNCQRHESTTHLGIKAFSCDQCKKSFTEKKSLITHVRTKHNGERPYQCQICLKNFTQRSPLVAHMARHSTGPSFDCNVCGLSFIQKGRYMWHLSSCAGNPAYVGNSGQSKTFTHLCHLCSSTFYTKKELLQHLATKHQENEHTVIFECNTCGSQFTEEKELNDHLLNSHNEPDSDPVSGNVADSEMGNIQIVLEDNNIIVEEVQSEEMSVARETDAEMGEVLLVNDPVLDGSSVSAMKNNYKGGTDVSENLLSSARRSSRTSKPTWKTVKTEPSEET